MEESFYICGFCGERKEISDLINFSCFVCNKDIFYKYTNKNIIIKL